MSRNVTKTGQHGSRPSRPTKTALGCKSSILTISDRSGPVEHRRFFSKLPSLARMSRNVTKTGQHGSRPCRPPKTALGCKSSILTISDRSGPVEHRHFFSKLLCLARMSRKVTKTGQDGSRPLRHRKTALGCKSSIMTISVKSGPVEHRRFFQICSP